MAEDTETNVDTEVPKPRAAGDARAAEAAAGAAAAERIVSAFEGSHKQSADINQEELLALLGGLAAKGATREDALNALNGKRTYDQAQSTDLLTQQGDLNHRQNLNSVALQALQNAVENANFAAKQHLAHRDIATDRSWNVDEQGWQVTEIMRSNVFKEAVAKAAAEAAQSLTAAKKG